MRVWLQLIQSPVKEDGIEVDRLSHGLMADVLRCEAKAAQNDQNNEPQKSGIDFIICK